MATPMETRVKVAMEVLQALQTSQQLIINMLLQQMNELRQKLAGVETLVSSKIWEDTPPTQELVTRLTQCLTNCGAHIASENETLIGLVKLRTTVLQVGRVTDAFEANLDLLEANMNTNLVALTAPTLLE